MMAEEVLKFGLNDGTPFPEQTDIKSLAFGGGSFLDRIIINGNVFGGPGGKQTETLTLQPGEYISRIQVYHGNVVDRISLMTNLGRRLAAGQGHSPGAMYFHIRQLLGISGRLGHFKPGEPLLVCHLAIRVDLIKKTANPND